MGYASSAVSTWSEARSGSLKSAIEVMSSSRSVRMTRTAISPRLAISTRRKRAGMTGARRTRGGAVAGLEALERDPREAQLGLLAAGLDDLGLLPADAAGEAGADGLERGFLGGEPGGQVGERVLVAAAVLELALGEEPLLHALAEAPQRLHQPLHLDHVDPDPLDGHHPSAHDDWESRRG